MLVLLIIFMITAPMMQHGMNIDIPKVTTKPLPTKDEPQILNITKDQGLILNEKKLVVKDLKAAIQLLFYQQVHQGDLPQGRQGSSLWICRHLHGSNP